MLQDLYCRVLELPVPGITVSLAEALRKQGQSFYHLPNHGNALNADKIHASERYLQAEKRSTAHLVHGSEPPSGYLFVPEGDATADVLVTRTEILPDRTTLYSCAAEQRESAPNELDLDLNSPSEEDIHRKIFSGTGGSTPVPPHFDSDDALADGDERSPNETRDMASSSYPRPRTPNPYSPGGGSSPANGTVPLRYESPTYVKLSTAENLHQTSAVLGMLASSDHFFIGLKLIVIVLHNRPLRGVIQNMHEAVHFRFC
jgi:hypothetical protein